MYVEGRIGLSRIYIVRKKLRHDLHDKIKNVVALIRTSSDQKRRLGLPDLLVFRVQGEDGEYVGRRGLEYVGQPFALRLDKLETDIKKPFDMVLHLGRKADNVILAEIQERPTDVVARIGLHERPGIAGADADVFRPPS